MAKSKLTDVLSFILPKGKPKPAGTASTSTFNPTRSAGTILPGPATFEHLNDILTSRLQSNARELIQNMMRNDPDVSAATNAYLTVANQFLRIQVLDSDGTPNPDGYTQLNQLLSFIGLRNDYTLGFQINKSIYGLIEDMRYMILLRGGLGSEVVLNQSLLPTEIRIVDPDTLVWTEDTPGQYKPAQRIAGVSQPVSLDIPTFFMGWFRKDPTNINTHSPFVSVINTVAARQQVVNDLYRIMQRSGYPRIHIKVLEEILRNSAPEDARMDQSLMKAYLKSRLDEIRAEISSLRADDILVTTNAIESGMMNADAPGMSIDISSIIEVLNSQNQAALKTMATLIGRGTQGVNTASVEAIIFALNADALNEPIAEILGNMFTLMLRIQGFDGYVDVEFEKVELRPPLELEPQKALKQARLLECLSLGLISDHEFHLEMFGRPKDPSLPDLSGTGFYSPQAGSVDPTQVSPNNDPVGRSVTPKGGKAAGGNAVTKKKPSVVRTPTTK